MSQSTVDRPADLIVRDLSIWIHDRQFPDSDDYWDGNWLRLQAVMCGNGARVSVDGAYLMTSDFASFHAQLSEMYSSLSGEAELRGLEPNISLALSMDRTGHIAGTVEITPDQLDQQHYFHFGLDQSYLPPILAALQSILQDYPVRSKPD